MFFIKQLLIITTFVEIGYGIKCYSCESVYEQNCGENFEVEPHFKLDCDLLIPPRYLERKLPPSKRNATGCLKRVYQESETIKIERHCFFGNVNGTTALLAGCQIDPTRSKIKEISCLVCDNENYCNGGHLFRIPLSSFRSYIRSPIIIVAFITSCLNLFNFFFPRI